MAQLILPPDYDWKKDPRQEANEEALRRIDETVSLVAIHWRQRRSWRVRLRRRLVWWTILLGLRPLVQPSVGDQFWAFTPALTVRQLFELPASEQVAMAMAIGDLVVREEIIIRLVRKKKISLDLSPEW